MGEDKAGLAVGGEALGARIARELKAVCRQVTVLGREPIEGCRSLLDEDEFQGPLRALSRFEPESDFVFVCSCDLPLFRRDVVRRLREKIEDRQACIPVLNDRLQPLCALYRSDAIMEARKLDADGERRIMKWIATLDYNEVSLGDEVRNVNTQEELRELGLESG
jgi:molybdopterin-guanine dinucleotide biosynthesis protein A